MKRWSCDTTELTSAVSQSTDPYYDCSHLYDSVPPPCSTGRNPACDAHLMCMCFYTCIIKGCWLQPKENVSTPAAVPRLEDYSCGCFLLLQSVQYCSTAKDTKAGRGKQKKPQKQTTDREAEGEEAGLYFLIPVSGPFITELNLWILSAAQEPWVCFFWRWKCKGQ